MRRGELKTVVGVLVLMCATLAGADYEAGQRAWEAGRRAEAIAEWRAGADAGEAKSMLALGRLYLRGLGVPQNYVQAHMWFNLAASRGEAAAIAERDALAAKMTPDALAEAQNLALDWQPSNKRASTTPATPAPAAQSDGPPPRAIREAQRLLAALGYQPGPADGLWGGRTLEAWQAFLRDAGQSPADTLRPEALSALRHVAQRQGVAPARSARPAQPTRRDIPPDALHRAVQTGDINGLHAALAAGVDVNERGRPRLDRAHARGQPGLHPAGAATAESKGRPERARRGRCDPRCSWPCCAATPRSSPPCSRPARTSRFRGRGVGPSWRW